MSLLRKTRTEVAGAWRSLRYDLGRRPVEPPAGGPDVTSTGMSTFGAPVVTMHTEQPVPAGRPRRAVTAGVFGVLTVAGAAAAYLTVVNGLGSLTTEQPAAAGTLPARPAATSDAQVGQGPAPSRVAPPTTAGAATTVTAAGPAAQAPQPLETTTSVRAKPATPTKVTKPTNHDCACDNPPVPTPTAPTSAPSPTPSPASPSSAGPSPSESSATPDESNEPSESPRSRHRRHHR